MVSTDTFDVDCRIEPQVRPYCGPIFFAHSPLSPPPDIVANGSFALVDTGIKRLLITCSHVLDSFQRHYFYDRRLNMCICLDDGLPIILDPKLIIDKDDRPDLASFDMSGSPRLPGDRQFYPLQDKPRPALTRGDQLVFVGYPGHLRSSEPGALRFGRKLFAVDVSDVSNFRIVADISKLQEPIHNSAPNRDLFGGLSGSPCFLSDNHHDLHLVGFVTSLALNLLRLTDARCLKPNGLFAIPSPP